MQCKLLLFVEYFIKFLRALLEDFFAFIIEFEHSVLSVVCDTMTRKRQRYDSHSGQLGSCNQR